MSESYPQKRDKSQRLSNLTIDTINWYDIIVATPSTNGLSDLGQNKGAEIFDTLYARRSWVVEKLVKSHELPHYQAHKLVEDAIKEGYLRVELWRAENVTIGDEFICSEDIDHNCS